MVWRKVNFILAEMTFLRYFIPLIIEGNNRGLESTIFYLPCNKYTCPRRHYDILVNLSSEYKFDIKNIDQINENSGLMFMIEGVGRGYCDNRYKKISLTYMTDFVGMYAAYVHEVDYVIFPSEFMASLRSEISVSEKDLYLGSPKYDISFDSEEIYKKYNINDNKILLYNKKKAFVILPRQRDMLNVDFKILYDSLRELDFSIITKTRGKDPFSQSHIRGNYHFMDFSWYPHDSMELMHASDLVINFSSTAIKECVLLKKPLVNFHIKPFKKPLDFLYDYKYCENFEAQYDIDKFKESVQFLTSADLDSEFDMSIKNHLFEKGNVSKKILDYLER